MQAPVDYPLIDHAHSAQFTVDELTYATLLDRTDTLVPASVDASTSDPDNSQHAASQDLQLLKPIALLAQTLLPRGNGACNGACNDERTGTVDGMFSRWSRARR